MRRILTYIIITLVLAVTGGCQNDGHIGWIFGVWRVAEFTVDGEKQTDPLISGTTLAFQSDVVEAVAIIDKYNSTYELFGTWKHEGDTFTMDFTHHDDTYAPGTGPYSAPWWLQMTSDEPMVMKITDQKGDAFTLTWQAPDGKTNVYKLRKTW